MASEHIATYLNDHLAGSVVALELLDKLEATHSDALRDFFRGLHADVLADRDELLGLMERLQISESRTRKASAWLAEKMTELKLRLDDPQRGLGRNQNKERSMTHFWHYLFAPTNKKPEASHEAFSGAA